MDRKKKEQIFIILFWLVNVAIWVPLFISRSVWHQGYNDYSLHNMFATRFWSEEGFQITHPAYAIVVGGVAKLLSLNTIYVSVAVMTISQLLSVYLGSLLMKELDKGGASKLQYLLMSFALNMIQPLILPGFLVGPNSANGYISPTMIMCKPFTMIVMLLFFQMYEKKKYPWKNQVCICLLMAVSSYIKPLFSMAFIPGIGILLFVEQLIEIKKGKKFGNAVLEYWKEVWPLFINGLILILQYIQNINLKVPEDLNVGWGQDAPIRFGLFYAWRLVVPSVLGSILLAYALPIFIIFVIIKNKIVEEKLRTFGKLTLAYGLVSFLYIACLYQEGFAVDLNFRNAWVVTFSYVYAICIILLVKWNRQAKVNLSSNQNQISKTELFVADLLFLGHFLCGVLMIIKNYMS